MVAQKYRWDFVGLSTDEKPTASTSEKVVDGSTYYCADNSKLYVWYGSAWYEKTVSGGGGGSYTAGTGINIADDTISVDTTTIQPKLTAGTNITISDDTISATDTTYSNFTGTDGTSAGVAGLVPAPATTDAGKFLKADGTWDIAGGGGSGVTELTSADYNYPTNNPTSVALWKLSSGAYMWGNVSVKASSSTDVSGDHFAIVGEKQTGGGIVDIISLGDGSSQTSGNYNLINTYTVEYSNGNLLNSKYALTRDNVVQSTGTSTTNVMSQNAVTSMVYADPSAKTRVQIGVGASTDTNNEIAIGPNAICANYASYGIALGRYAEVYASSSTALGDHADCSGSASYSVALGANSKATQKGQVDISTLRTTNTNGYNNSQYRLLTGLYDPQSAHDAATKGYVDSQLVYAIGDTITISQDGTYVAGRQKVSGTTKTIECAIPINKPLASDITTITFTPSGYNEAFGSQGLLFSKNNPTSSDLTFDCTKSTNGLALIKVVITAVDSNINLQHNNCCSVHLSGTFTLS